MSYEPMDAELDADELKLTAALRPDQVQSIDAALLNASDHRWRKVAWVVGTVMGIMPDRVPGIPEASTLSAWRRWWRRGALRVKATCRGCVTARCDTRLLE